MLKEHNTTLHTLKLSTSLQFIEQRFNYKTLSKHSIHKSALITHYAPAFIALIPFSPEPAIMVIFTRACIISPPVCTPAIIGAPLALIISRVL